jgi:predicted transglutaminase-like protease
VSLLMLCLQKMKDAHLIDTKICQKYAQTILVRLKFYKVKSVLVRIFPPLKNGIGYKIWLCFYLINILLPTYVQDPNQ